MSARRPHLPFRIPLAGQYLGDLRTSVVRESTSTGAPEGKLTGQDHEGVDASLVAEGNIGVQSVSDHDHAALVELVSMDVRSASDTANASFRKV